MVLYAISPETYRIGSPSIKIARIAQDIANAYFRKAISDKANELKIVLVVSHHDLDDRAGNLPKSIRDFGYFMQGIESDDPLITERIKCAVSIVVTKIKDPMQRINGLEREIAGLQGAILALGNNAVAVAPLNVLLQTKETELRALSANAMSPVDAVEISLKDFIAMSPSLRTVKHITEILTHVVDKKQFALFSTPDQQGDKTFDEAAIIRDLIENKITFISREDAKID